MREGVKKMNKQEIITMINNWMEKKHAVAFYLPKRKLIRFNGHTCLSIELAIKKMQEDLWQCRRGKEWGGENERL